MVALQNDEDEEDWMYFPLDDDEDPGDGEPHFWIPDADEAQLERWIKGEAYPTEDARTEA